MKFKAFLTQDGVGLLEKRFLPALDKVGRVCHMYLTPDHAMFLHNLAGGGDGIQCVAQFNKDLLFCDYRISSQNSDKIAFAVDVALLHRALRSALTVQAQSDPASVAIQIKLVKKLPAGSRNATPFLTFETKGLRSAVVQDVPISKPLSKADVVQLQAALDAAQDLPQTLVQVPDLSQLQSLVDRLKNVGELLTVAITQYGDLHLQVSTSLITIGSEFRKLRVLGTHADPPVGNQNSSAPSRMEMAIQRGEALSVVSEFVLAYIHLIARFLLLCYDQTASEHEASCEELAVSISKAGLRLLWDWSTGCLLDSDIPVLHSRNSDDG
ncbi:uncharacterized protein [Typha latifolia]|uniref:uncharacterized protein isoform X1 n=1 Tax=Typha latifolia TaxID=4733 RepID=UPI003C2CB1AC